MNGSRPFVGGRTTDGGGLTKVTPSTVGETDGLAVGVREFVGCGLAGHALLLEVASAKPWNEVVGDALTRGRSGIGGGGVGATPGFAVTVTTILSETGMPCARASAPTASIAAPAVAALSMRVRMARRRDRLCTQDVSNTG